jgi:ABC-type transporter Mla subunit MlaD
VTHVRLPTGETRPVPADRPGPLRERRSRPRPGRDRAGGARTLLARASVAADSAGDSLAAAAQALDQTSTSFDGFSKSLDDAKTSSAHASQLLNDAATTSSQLADGMAISLFGAQPFLALSQSFRRNTDELRGVSADISTLSEAIGHNATDVAAVGTTVWNVTLQRS